MYKTCNWCGLYKKISSFGKVAKNADGHNKVCKICLNAYHKRKRQEQDYPLRKLNLPRLSNVSKKDYCFMYEFLEKIGYDLQRDIHLQFCEKYNLKPKKRPSKHESRYKPDDCSNNS